MNAILTFTCKTNVFRAEVGCLSNLMEQEMEMVKRAERVFRGEAILDEFQEMKV